jgi:hypothetical protein
LEEWWYNTSFYTLLKMSPFMAIIVHPSQQLERESEGSSNGGPHREPTRGSPKIE